MGHVSHPGDSLRLPLLAVVVPHHDPGAVVVLGRLEHFHLALAVLLPLEGGPVKIVPLVPAAPHELREEGRAHGPLQRVQGNDEPRQRAVRWDVRVGHHKAPYRVLLPPAGLGPRGEDDLEEVGRHRGELRRPAQQIVPHLPLARGLPLPRPEPSRQLWLRQEERASHHVDLVVVLAEGLDVALEPRPVVPVEPVADLGGDV
mmetsp:Transcript_6716/g.23155  ORF Transcript_6716/g.23155 Transcript_6716/m.23155 type:complete len:202 (+) Transcript_6716:152-757(+)